MSWSAERREEKLSGWLTGFGSRTRVDSLLTGRADGAAGGIQGERGARRITWDGVCGLCSVEEEVAPVRCCAAEPRSISYGICISIFFPFFWRERAFPTDTAVAACCARSALRGNGLGVFPVAPLAVEPYM